MANPRYNSYKLDMLSPEAKKILADVLIEMGYRDRFVIENGPTEFVKPIREFVAKHRGRAFILSSYMDGCQALAEKQEWVDEYIPEIDRAHRLFVPCGESKAEYVKEYFGIPALTEAMVLFDDFSKNLHLWKAAGGRGIKCFNGINGNHGTWTGDGVMWSKEIREKLETCK